MFCDDLSFDEGEAGYKALKSVLDGSVAATSENLLIYATSNRRHLLPEYMKENLTYTHTDDGEVHPGEVVEEKISLSERFGLWISFYPFSQQEYLAIVAQWLRTFGAAEATITQALKPSLVWALERGSRSGRVAYQFARDWAGRSAGAEGMQAPPCKARSRPGMQARAWVRMQTTPMAWTMSEREAARRIEPRLATPRRCRGRRADRRARPLPADIAARRQGLRRVLGVSGRQIRARRDRSSRRCGVSCTKNWASRSAPSSPGTSSWSTIRTRWCDCIFARCSIGPAEFEMREQQSMAWESLPVRSRPVLPGTVPVLRWFAAERGLRRRHACRMSRLTTLPEWIGSSRSSGTPTAWCR